MKQSNKLLLSIGSIVVAATPITTVISCGKSNNKQDKESDKISTDEIKPLEDKIKEVISAKDYLSNYSNQTPEEFVRSHMEWDEERFSWVSKKLEDFGLSFLNDQNEFYFDISSNLSFDSNNILGKMFFTINVWHQKNKNLESGYAIHAESLNFKSSDPDHLNKIQIHDGITKYFFEKFGTERFDGENLSLASSTLSNKSVKEFFWNKTSTKIFKHFDAFGSNISLVENELGINFMPSNIDLSTMGIVSPDIDMCVAYGRDSNGWTLHDVKNMFENGFIELKLFGNDLISGNEFNESNPFCIKVSGFKTASQVFTDTKNAILQKITHTTNGETWTGIKVTARHDESPYHYNYEHNKNDFNWGRKTETAYGVVTTNKPELDWYTDEPLSDVYKAIRNLFYDENSDIAPLLWGCSIWTTVEAEFDDTTKTMKVHWVLRDSPFLAPDHDIPSAKYEFEHNSFSGFGSNSSDLTFTIKFNDTL